MNKNYCYRKDEEIKKWLIENYKDSRESLDSLTEKFNQDLGKNIKKSSLKSIASMHKIAKKMPYKYPEEERNWLKENFFKYETNAKLKKAYEEKFNKKSNGITDLTNELGLLRGAENKGMFKSGEREHSKFLHKIGEEVRYQDTIWVKVSDLPSKKGDSYAISFKRNWVMKKRYLYEQYHNCKLTSDDQIIYLDGDINNYSIDNLVRITKAENLKLQQMNAMCKGEITLTALEVIRCMKEVKKLK